MIFFPTYASYNTEADTWSVDLHVWVYRVAEDAKKRNTLARLFHRTLGVDKKQTDAAIYQRRASLFLVDAVKRRTMSVLLGDLRLPIGQTRKSGHLQTTLELPGRIVREHATDPQTLRFELTETDLPIGITVRLIPPDGVSIISDIDDTTKASYAWKKRKLVKTTFTRPWKPTKGLASLYDRWAKAGAAFHYVSTSPWQLYPSLAQFNQRAGYPDGTFHLKRFRWKDRSFFDLFAKSAKYKPKLIEPIIQRFPGRRFILVGDSGEHDPEIYADLARRHPSQITSILIRDVKKLGEDHPRFAKAFADIPDDRWQVFRKAKQIRTPPGLPAREPAAAAKDDA